MAWDLNPDCLIPNSMIFSTCYTRGFIMKIKGDHLSQVPRSRCLALEVTILLLLLFLIPLCFPWLMLWACLLRSSDLPCICRVTPCPQSGEHLLPSLPSGPQSCAPHRAGGRKERPSAPGPLGHSQHAGPPAPFLLHCLSAASQLWVAGIPGTAGYTHSLDASLRWVLFASRAAGCIEEISGMSALGTKKPGINLPAFGVKYTQGCARYLSRWGD